jgi:signal transduction histidine kinase
MRNIFILILFISSALHFNAQQADSTQGPTYDSLYIANHILKAESYLERSLLDSALLQTDTSLYAASILDHPSSLYEIYILRGSILEHHPKKSALAENNFLEAISIAGRLNQTAWQTDAMDCLYQFYLHKKQFEKAHAIYKERAGLIYQLDKEHEEVTVQLFRDSIASLNAKLSSEQKNLMIQKDLTSMFQMLFYVAVGLVLLLLVILFVIIARNAKKKKQLREEGSQSLEQEIANTLDKEKLLEKQANQLSRNEQEMIKMRYLIGEQLREQHETIKTVNHGLVDLITESRMQLELIGRDPGGQLAVDKYMSLQNLLTKASNETRQLAGNIFTTKGNIAERLESLCNSYIRPQLNIQWANSAGDIQLLEQQQMAILDVVDELLHNIDKHSEATEVHISFEKSNGKVKLKVDDNGRGFDVKSSLPKGRGLRKIIALITYLNGDLNVVSDTKNGTHFIIEWPQQA